MLKPYVNLVKYLISIFLERKRLVVGARAII